MIRTFRKVFQFFKFVIPKDDQSEFNNFTTPPFESKNQKVSNTLLMMKCLQDLKYVKDSYTIKRIITSHKFNNLYYRHFIHFDNNTIILHMLNIYESKIFPLVYP